MDFSSARGQISLPIAIIGAMGVIVAAAFTSWATAQSNISSVNTKVDVVVEREANHYMEMQKQLDTIEKKIDLILEKKASVMPSVIR